MGAKTALDTGDLTPPAAETASPDPRRHPAAGARRLQLPAEPPGGRRQGRPRRQAQLRVAADDMARDGVTVEAEKFKARVEKFAAAPALVFACVSVEDMAKQPDAERQSVERDLAVQSLGAALENLLLAAHDAGLGACWFCAPAFCKDAVREALGIPAEVEPQALIALGYPDEKPLAPPRKQLGELCFRDGWGVGFG